MKIKINLKEKHVWMISLMLVIVGATLVLAQTLPNLTTVNGGTHPLASIARGADMVPVDFDSNGIIDKANWAESANSIEWDGVYQKPIGIELELGTCAWTGKGKKDEGHCANSCTDAFGDDFVMVEQKYSNSKDKLNCRCCKIVLVMDKQTID